MKTSKFLIIFMFFFIVPAVCYPAGYVRRIIIFGNEKTERKALLKIIGVQKNEFVDAQRLKKIEENLLNCGLFRDVKVKSRKIGTNRLDITVTIAEKTSIFIFPIFRAWSGRYSGGLIFGESNLFGNNKKTLILGEGGNDLSQFFIAYDDNSVFGSDYTMRVQSLFRVDDVPLYVGYVKRDEITVKDAGIMIMPGFKWTDEITTRMGFDIKYLWYEQRTAPIVTVDTLSGLNFSMRFEFEYNSLKRREALLNGWLLKAQFEFSDKRIGSDYEYDKEELDVQFATQFLKYFNWMVQFQGKIGRDLPFHEQYTLGGTSLRGYKEREFRGDGLIRLVNEVTYPLFTVKSVSFRGLTFFDTGLVYFDADGISKTNYNSGTGGGLRIYLKKVVMPLLGLDFGYGIDHNTFGVYFYMGLSG